MDIDNDILYVYKSISFSLPPCNPPLPPRPSKPLIHPLLLYLFTFVCMISSSLFLSLFYVSPPSLQRVIPLCLGTGGDQRQPITRSLANERVRRQAPANQNVRGFNEEEKRIFVDKHNDFRRLAGASNMNYMVSTAAWLLCC